MKHRQERILDNKSNIDTDERAKLIEQHEMACSSALDEQAQKNPEEYRKREAAMVEKIKDRFSFVRLFELIDLVYKQGDQVNELKERENKWQDKLKQ